MTREEEIKEFAHDYSEENYKGDSYEAYAEKEDIAKSCVNAIRWADQHPRKGLWDAEKVIKWLENNAGIYLEDIRKYEEGCEYNTSEFIALYVKQWRNKP